MSGIWHLDSHPVLKAPEGPVALVILDGVGLGPADAGNAWHLAHTPFLDRLWQGPLTGSLKAHGTSVGMPSDGDMGNSEVGHNAIGAGRVFNQGAKLVEDGIASGTVFESESWNWVIEPSRQGATLHFIGLLSDGNVHSHIEHLKALITSAVTSGTRKIRVHPLLDGRDVGETTALDYVEPFEAFLTQLREGGVDARIASGGGRMVTTMDRYEADWSIVSRGWDAHVHGKARAFPSCKAAINAFRAESPGITDQNLPAFVVTDENGPVGRIEDGDGVIFFNFRGDRAIEITQAFEAGPEFSKFDRGQAPKVRFAGMMQYDGDLALPRRYLVAPPEISRTVGEYLAANGRSQLACSETQKFGHVTYFFNGNKSGKFEESLEVYEEIPSDRIEFNERPWMKAAEITDAVLAQADRFGPDFIRVNFANGDMVGHTGDLRATQLAMAATDLALERLITGLLKRGARCIVTADHGNCEEMIMKDKKTGAFVRSDSGAFKPKTSHTLNPVPAIVIGEERLGRAVSWNRELKDAGLASLPATCLNLMGYRAPDDYAPSLLRSQD